MDTSTTCECAFERQHATLFPDRVVCTCTRCGRLEVIPLAQQDDIGDERETAQNWFATICMMGALAWIVVVALVCVIARFL